MKILCAFIDVLPKTLRKYLYTSGDNKISGSDVLSGSPSCLAYVVMMAEPSDDSSEFTANLSCSFSSCEEGELLEDGRCNES